MDSKDTVSKEVFDSKVETLLILHDKTNERIDDLHSYITWGFSLLGILFVIVQLGIGFLLYLLTKTPG